MNDLSLRSDPTVQTVHDLIDLYDKIGIPHFQRGLVWNDENTSLLLESLYFDTPCGTIILWKPREPSKEGVPLSKLRDPEYLVIDGQQRIRCLRNALGPESECSAQDSSEDEGSELGDISAPNAQRVWCLNLSRVPEMAGFFDENMSRFPMFRLVTDPTGEGARVKHNLVPLRLFFEGRDADVRTLIQLTGPTTPEEALRKINEIRLGDRVRSLLEKNLFSLSVFEESSEEYHLADMVQLYNRINSAGKRVESEEKAFATLVSLYPSTSQWLKELFEAVHPDKDPARDELLKRRKERNFGFKLFIRTFIQVCTYHFGFSLGSNSFSFEVVNSLPFQTRLRNDPEVMRQQFDLTRQVVCFVRKLLRDGLYCDDLQMLPETTSLLPLFQVLIRFRKLMKPGMQGEYEKVLQCLTLRLVLSQDLSQEKVLDLVKLVDRAETAKKCFEGLDGEVHGPDKLKLTNWLQNSNTLQDRYKLMLYWLLRKRGARDFSYENQRGENPLRAKRGEAAALNEDVKPEKQHIVPYKWLQKLYNIEKRGRVSRHPVNNIGNITYISHDLNHWQTGLGSDAIKLSQEPPHNRDCHFLGTAGEVEVWYEKVRGMTEKSNTVPQEKARETFEEFCKRRRELIAEAFVEWLRELECDLTNLRRVEPEALVKPSVQDRVRSLDYADDVEDAVLELVAVPRLRFRWWQQKQGSGAKLNCRVKSSSDSDKKGFIIRFFNDQLKVEPAAGSVLSETLVNLMAGRVIRKEEDVKLGIWRLWAKGEESAITSKILIEVVQQFSGLTREG